MKKRTTYKHVRVRTTSIGKRCLRCKKSATVTAVRQKWDHLMPVWYCPEHWEAVRDG